MSEVQRQAAVAWFEKGLADTATANLLGVSRWPVKALYRRWRIRGQGALVTKPGKQSYSFDFKLALVERFLAGETAPDLAAEADLSSPLLLKKWARVYRHEGADALRPKPKRPTSEARDPTTVGDIRAGAAAPGKRTFAGRSGLSGKITGLEGSKTTVKVQALIALKADFPLPVLLHVSGLARSTFFYHQSRLQAPDPQEALKTAVTEIFTTNHGRYGHRRIHTELMKQGWAIAKKTVLKLMGILGLVCEVRRRKRYNS
ncbi:IS3 family transposase [Arthrobacter oryzae]|uniref:IS3 family transposase n=1 Tax=Arthrobacter oryzae TaxID=409290 RepID=UPI00273B8C32|nr:IS3 family transposase [Arthrobacter oryzae]WLQ06102.1 IS3 family transposase [Arthrobacter oryzae]